LIYIKKLLASDIGVSTIFNLFTKVIGLVGGFILTLLITNYFGLNTLGIYATVFTLINIAGLFGKFGLDIVAVKMIAEKDGLKDRQSLYRKLFIQVFIISTIVSVLFYFSSAFIVGKLLDNDKIIHITKMSSFVILPFSFFYLNIETLRGCGKITIYSFMYTSAVVLLNVLIILVIINSSHFELNSDLITYVLLISILIAFLISFILVINTLFKGNLWFLFQKKISVDFSLLKTSAPLLFSGALYMLMNRMDILMLNRFADLDAVGSYNIILKFSNLLPIGVMATNAMVGPMYSKYFVEKNFEEIEKLALNSTKLIFLIGLGVLIFLFLFKTQLISLFNIDYNVIITSYLTAIGLSFVYAMTGAVGLILQMTGKQNVQMYVSIFALIANVLLNIILIPIYGLLGAIFSTYLSLILLNITLSVIVKKEFGIRTIIKI